jgi:hypothetical protein
MNQNTSWESKSRSASLRPLSHPKDHYLVNKSSSLDSIQSLQKIQSTASRSIFEDQF